MSPDLPIGLHLSIAGGLPRALARASDLGCGALQLFVQNPRSWRERVVPEAEIALFQEERQRRHLGIVVAHLSYLPNLAASDVVLWQRSWTRLRSELALAKALGVDYLVCHPGHAEDGAAGRERLLAGLETTITALPPPPLLLLENTVGQRNALGADLTELGQLLMASQAPLGLCLDTAHAFAAGYDLRRAAQRQRLLAAIASGPGLATLKLIHLNDSLYPCGSRRDRHWHLGAGRIGAAALSSVLRQYVGQVTAIILETPQQEPGDDARNLAMARSLVAAAFTGNAAGTRLTADQDSD